MPDKKKAKLYILIPTYNEKANLPLVVKAIEKLNLDYDWWVMIIDDNSPDGTGKTALSYREQGKNVLLLSRLRKEGLGKAYQAGFDKACQDNAELVVTMDADLSHDPSCLPAILAETKSYDLVIGSRYVKGGKVIYPFHRRMLSVLANLFAKIMLGLKIHDITSGYNCYNRQALEKIVAFHPSANGYVFQVEMHFLASQLGLKIQEVPIVFRDRRFGKTKMSLAEAFFGIFEIWRMREENSNLKSQNSKRKTGRH